MTDTQLQNSGGSTDIDLEIDKIIADEIDSVAEEKFALAMAEAMMDNELAVLEAQESELLSISEELDNLNQASKRLDEAAEMQKLREDLD